MTKQGSADRLAPVVLGVAGLISGVLVWEVVSRVFVASDSFPPASRVLGTFWRLGGQQEFLENIGRTLTHWACGLAITVAIAVPVGLLLASNSVLTRATVGTINFLRSVPPIVILPMVLTIFGTGQMGILVLIVFGATWPILVSTMAGVRGVDPLMLDTGEAFRLRRWRTFWSITGPASLPQALAGVRVAASLALIVCVVTELIGSVPGIGQFILLAQLSGNYLNMYAGIVAVGVVGISTNGALSVVIDRLLRGFGPAAGGSA